MKLGQKVRLRTPDNPRLDKALGEVVALFEWGGHVLTPAAATGRYRALWSEMEPLGDNGHAAQRQARDKGYSGEECSGCGSLNVRQDGHCFLCDDCGRTSGCS